MTIKNWVENVNDNILLSGTSWNNVVNFKEDETRSGKRKRRQYASQTKREFSVKMRFTLKEYELFNTWYTDVICYGLYAFYFHKVDSNSKSETKVYRFTSDGAPSFSNVSGIYVDCSMKWEEV